jgi:hypothetical protein
VIAPGLENEARKAAALALDGEPGGGLGQSDPAQAAADHQPGSETDDGVPPAAGRPAARRGDGARPRHRAGRQVGVRGLDEALPTDRARPEVNEAEWLAAALELAARRRAAGPEERDALTTLFLERSRALGVSDDMLAAFAPADGREGDTAAVTGEQAPSAGGVHAA